MRGVRPLPRRFAALSLLAVLAASAAEAGESSTREIRRMEEIMSAVDAETLVVFDIDNTLISPEEELGSDQWYYALVDSLQREGRPEADAVDEAMIIWNRVQRDVRVKAVEADTPALVRKLQERRVRTMALTARTLDVAEVTVAQLTSVGIVFRPAAPLPPRLEVKGVEMARMESGILFVGERNNKGELLVALLDAIALKPARVVFVDDKHKHVENVTRALAKRGIPSRGFRYGAADEAVRRFRPEVAEAQYRRWRAKNERPAPAERPAAPSR